MTTFALGAAQEYNVLKIYGLVPDGPGSVWVAIGELGPEVFFHPYNSLGGELVHIAADGTVTRFPRDHRPRRRFRTFRHGAQP